VPQVDLGSCTMAPNPDLHNVFQQIGRTEYGDELEELWEQDVFEDSPQYRN
jgi:hypothetical protein